jgi:hypothetical protein
LESREASAIRGCCLDPKGWEPVAGRLSLLCSPPVVLRPCLFQVSSSDDLSSESKSPRSSLGGLGGPPEPPLEWEWYIPANNRKKSKIVPAKTKQRCYSYQEPPGKI